MRTSCDESYYPEAERSCSRDRRCARGRASTTPSAAGSRQEGWQPRRPAPAVDPDPRRLLGQSARSACVTRESRPKRCCSAGSPSSIYGGRLQDPREMRRSRCDAESVAPGDLVAAGSGLSRSHRRELPDDLSPEPSLVLCRDAHRRPIGATTLGGRRLRNALFSKAAHPCFGSDRSCRPRCPAAREHRAANIRVLFGLGAPPDSTAVRQYFGSGVPERFPIPKRRKPF